MSGLSAYNKYCATLPLTCAANMVETYNQLIAWRSATVEGCRLSLRGIGVKAQLLCAQRRWC
jgi:ABC-type enterobactin transport system permease subunit